jgi:hypothetical protein
MITRVKAKAAEKENPAERTAAEVIRSAIARLYEMRRAVEGEKPVVNVAFSESGGFRLSVESDGRTVWSIVIPRSFIEKAPAKTDNFLTASLDNLQTYLESSLNNDDKVFDVSKALLYNEGIMNDAATACKPAADYFGLPIEVVARKLKEAAAEAARETTGRVDAESCPDIAAVKAASRVMLASRKPGKRGPRGSYRPRAKKPDGKKSDPRLPDKAPEVYQDRKPRAELGGRKEKLVPFLRRVWGPLLDVMTQADLLRLDPPAYRAVYNCKDGQQLPAELLPREPRRRRMVRTQMAATP